MKHASFTVMCLLAILVPSLSLAELSPGDVFITGYNCDAAERDFSFIVLKDIPDTETIHFTDKGWTNDAALYGGEGIVSYMPPMGGLSAGSVVHITNTTTVGATGADQGTASKSGSFTLSGSGDQILVYQGTEESPVFISAINWDGTDWVDGDTSDKSLVPPGLTEGHTALHAAKDLDAAANIDNAMYTGLFRGLAQDIQLNIRIQSNWDFSDTAAFTLSSEDGWIVVPIAFQGFEGSSKDTWAIASGASISNNAGSSDYPSDQRIRSNDNSHQTADNSHTLILSEVSTEDFTDVTVTLNVSSTSLTSGNGADGPDYVKVYLALDGAAFPATPDITLNGFNNARWSYSNVSTNTAAGVPIIAAPAAGGSRDGEGDGYSVLTISIPDDAGSVELKIDTSNNSPNEVFSVDDISLRGTSKGTVILLH